MGTNKSILLLTLPSQSPLIVMAFVLCHNLSDEALNDLLLLKNLHCPGSVLKSKYLLYKCSGDPNYKV